MLARLEFIILTATLLGEAWGESGNSFGILGKDVHAETLSQLTAAGAVQGPARATGLYGTYVMRCRSFGLLGAGGSGPPVWITPRGHRQWIARRELSSGSRLVEIIAAGGAVDVATLNDEGRLFSANGLASCSSTPSRLSTT